MRSFIDDIYDHLRSARTSGYHDGRYNMGYDDALDYAIAALEMLIVRCKDCKHRDSEDKKCDLGCDIVWQLPRRDDFYCAYAERREDLK